MIRFGSKIFTFIFILLLTGSFVPPMAVNATPVIEDSSVLLLTGKPGIASHQADETNDTGPGARLVSDDANGVTFEVTVPWEQITLEEVTAGDSQYIRLSLPGYAQTGKPGAPALPFLTRQIGAPFGVGVDIQVIPGPGHTQVLSVPILPVVTQLIEPGTPEDGDGLEILPEPTFVYQEDPAVYASGKGYPERLAELTSDGVMRQQRVVGINVYPVQYQPGSREITVYESMRILLTFSGARSRNSQAAVPESSAYESLLGRELLNYESARQWRQPPDLNLLSTPAGFDTGLKAASIPWTPPNPGWRIKVRENGFYKLTYTELAAAGLPVDTLDPRTFEVYNLGVPVAIQVQGETDGRFDTSDYLLFYGQKLASKYTLDNVYWLTYGETSVTRITQRSGTPGTADTPDHYSAVRFIEENTYYLSQSPGNDNLDRWFWTFIRTYVSKSWTTTFQLTAPYSSTATLKLKILGIFADAINPDHHVTVKLNGQTVGDTKWDGITWQNLEMTIPAGVLNASPVVNTLVITCPIDIVGVGKDWVYIDGFELNYSNTFVAEDNKLAFTYSDAGTWKYEVTGFTTDTGLAVYDVTNPAAVVQITGAVVSAVSPYALQFEDRIEGSTSYWTTAGSKYLQVQGIEADTASTLGSSGNGADHIAITHHDFLTQSQSLSDYRATQGLRAVTVDVQDVYDEFGYGIVSPGAIHDFLAYAYTSWQAPSPTYVVLVGDGYYDPKNYKGYSNSRVSFIPPFLTFSDPWLGETATDNRYVTLVGDDFLADMMLGRLAVNSAAEASAFITKIINYEKIPVSGDWQHKVLAVADDADSGGNFALVSDELLSDLLPTTYQVERVYYKVTHATETGAQEAILASINAGNLIVNYIGHGASDQWGDFGSVLFKSTYVAGLVNGGKLPVILAMTCKDGLYHNPDDSALHNDSTAEVITRADGKGAVASWSPTGLGVSTGHDYLNRGFYEALFQNNVSTLGGATSAGLLKLFATGFSLDLLDTYLLFGDPATKLPVSVPHPSIPDGTITSRNPKFTWKPVEGATGYTLLIKQGETIIREEEVTPVTCNATACGYTFPVKLNLLNNTYTWTVKAYRGFWGSYGPAKSFTVVNPPAPRFPSVSATTPNPKFIWTKVADQTRYQIFLYDAKGALVFKQMITSPVCGTTTCGFTPSPALALTNGTYKWKIQAYNGLWGMYSALKSFNLVDPPEPMAPRGTIWNSNPTFSWMKIPGATKYQIVIQTSLGAKVKSIELTSPTCGSTTCSYKPNPVLNLVKGIYKWKVRAYNGYYGLYSAYMSFTKN